MVRICGAACWRVDVALRDERIRRPPGLSTRLTSVMKFVVLAKMSMVSNDTTASICPLLDGRQRTHHGQSQVIVAIRLGRIGIASPEISTPVTDRAVGPRSRHHPSPAATSSTSSPRHNSRAREYGEVLDNDSRRRPSSGVLLSSRGLWGTSPEVPTCPLPDSSGEPGFQLSSCFTMPELDSALNMIRGCQTAIRAERCD